MSKIEMRYFVVNPIKDNPRGYASRKAVLAYADAIYGWDEELAGELRSWIDSIKRKFHENSENESKETSSIKEQYQKDIGDLTQALLDIQHILKCAPQTTWCDCVLDICREALAGSLHENCNGAPDGGHTAECKAKKI